MSFFSTRGSACVTASQAILWGLAKDGGLYVPSMFPHFDMDTLVSMSSETYQQQAVRVLREFLEDYSTEEIAKAVQSAYNDQSFDHADIAPVHALSSDTHVLELFHGPTLAFKDMALQLLPYLVSMAAEKNAEKREVSIIVATSGDTGKAALEGFKDVKGTSCSVFYPQHGVSQMQQLQMITTEGDNTHVIGIEGNFDNAQTGVKQLFADQDFQDQMNAMGKLPSSANSINFGRLVPQIIYYFTAYNNLVKRKVIRLGQSINFVVPTGNFGNILAGYYAIRMGLPIKRLICASNRNNVLTNFFEDGTYYTHRHFFQTMSPSMDILISSNLERLLYEFAGRDGSVVSMWMQQLKECGSFSIGAQRLGEMKKIFWAGCADDTMTATQIRQVYDRYHYVMDPHTAVASDVLQQYREQTGDHTTAVIVSTASPYKFPEDVMCSVTDDQSYRVRGAFESAKALKETSGVAIPAQIDALQNLPVRHETVCEVADMKETFLQNLQN